MLVLRSLSMLVLLSGLCSAQGTERVSIGTNAVQSSLFNDSAVFGRSISADGRFIVFWSNSSNLVGNDNNGVPDVFVRDRLSGITELVSVSSTGAQGDGVSGAEVVTLSANGEVVAFTSDATNLVAGDTNGCSDVYVHDRGSGLTELISIGYLGAQSDFPSATAVVASDGRHVAFASAATNLVPGDSNWAWDCFLHDRQSGVTARVSLANNGLEGNGASGYPVLSRDGRFVGFSSDATNLVQGDTNGSLDGFVRDLSTGTTLRVSVDSSGSEASGPSSIQALSAHGRYVLFASAASNLVAGDTNGVVDAFLHDMLSGTTERVGLSASGAQPNADCWPRVMSEDGRYILLESAATNLTAGDTNGVSDVFLRDRVTGTTERVSVAADGSQANGASRNGSLTNDGRYLLFSSDASNLVPGDTNNFGDVFLRDRFATGFTSLCDPGANGVSACPCANPPAGTGRGCDNSASTGGAALTAGGIAYLSLDSLVFHTSGERPNATSVLLQGDSLLANGAVFGQGVRCAGGALKRMYVKAALGGGIVAPDLSAGDATISMRSALLGAPIQAGQPHFFLVYYRDPLVLGGCPATSTFNCTQTGSVVYWP